MHRVHLLLWRRSLRHAKRDADFAEDSPVDCPATAAEGELIGEPEVMLGRP